MNLSLELSRFHSLTAIFVELHTGKCVLCDARWTLSEELQFILSLSYLLLFVCILLRIKGSNYNKLNVYYFICVLMKRIFLFYIHTYIFFFSGYMPSSGIAGSYGSSFLFFFFFWHLYWSIIALQWCVSFCCITKWVSYTYTHVPTSLPSCVSLPPTLPIPPL